MARDRGIDAELLERKVEPELALHGFELVELQLLRGGGRLTLRFTIDKTDGVSVSDCASMDRAISHLLEADAESLGRYVVEVSSPGIFRQLRRPAHYGRYVGEIVKLIMVDGDGPDTVQLRGPLESVEDDGISIGTEDGLRQIPFTAIRSAHLDPDLKIGKGKSNRSVRRGGGESKGREAKRPPKGI